MALIGPLLKSRRHRDAYAAWSRLNFQGPETMVISSAAFTDGELIPREHIGRRVGGRNLSPDLTWNTLPAGVTELLVVVEDLDVPTPKPAVHCLALVEVLQLDVANHLAKGALSARQPASGVRILRSTVTRGYHGPEPLKGHGPHRYSFQLFALSGERDSALQEKVLEQVKPRTLLATMATSVVARGRLIGVYER